MSGSDHVPKTDACPCGFFFCFFNWERKICRLALYFQRNCRFENFLRIKKKGLYYFFSKVCDEGLFGQLGALLKKIKKKEENALPTKNNLCSCSLFPSFSYSLKQQIHQPPPLLLLLSFPLFVARPPGHNRNQPRINEEGAADQFICFYPRFLQKIEYGDSS